MNSKKHPQTPVLKTAVPNVANIIAIASGKGGVGKSSLAVNLALALQKLGKRAGLLDADIYGPSQPWMLGTAHSPALHTGNQLQPVECHGLVSMSISYLMEDKESPMVWRGPMVSQALQQMLYATQWPALDYLVVDLPPGTGDIQLTLAQKIPVQGVVIVTTPQEVALLDAKKALLMFKKLNIPILGVVENMAGHTCSACGHEENIFGESGGARLAALFGLPLLGKIPLATRIRVHLDAGTPTMVAAPEDSLVTCYLEIAERVDAIVAKQNLLLNEENSEQAIATTPKAYAKIAFKYETLAPQKE